MARTVRMRPGDVGPRQPVVGVLLAASLLALAVAACGSSPGGSTGPSAATSTPDAATASPEPASPDATPTEGPTAVASPIELSGSFTLTTDPNVQKVTAGGECLVDAGADWLQFNLLSPMDGSTMFSMTIGRTEGNPDGESVAGGGSFTADSIVAEGTLGSGSVFFSPDATATVSADLRSAEIKGVAGSGNQQVAYTYAFTCTD